MTWLVTGGAGYIGSHVVRAFAAEGIPAVVIDDLSSGHRSFVGAGRAVLSWAACCSGELLDQIFTEHNIAGVVHLAGFKYAGVSVSRPLHTYTQNVTGMITLLEAMAGARRRPVRLLLQRRGVRHAQTPTWSPRTDPTRPESPYGESKLIGEWLLRDQAAATASDAAALRHTSLRYFNVVGSGYPDLRDTSPHNLFPLIFERWWPEKCPTSTATTTPPRTAPASATTCTSPTWRSPTSPPPRPLTQGRPLEPVYNLGSGTGLSVRQIMDAVARVTGIDFTPGSPAAPPRRSGADRGHRRAGRDATWTGRCGTPSTRWSPPPGPRAKPPSSKDDQKWSPATEISSDLLLILTTFVGTGRSEPK